FAEGAQRIVRIAILTGRAIDSGGSDGVCGAVGGRRQVVLSVVDLCPAGTSLYGSISTHISTSDLKRSTMVAARPELSSSKRLCEITYIQAKDHPLSPLPI